MCGLTITADQFTAHYALELSKLSEHDPSSLHSASSSSSFLSGGTSPQHVSALNSPSSPSRGIGGSGGRGKREAAVHARKKVHNQIQLLKPSKGKRGKVTVDHEEVFLYFPFIFTFYLIIIYISFVLLFVFFFFLVTLKFVQVLKAVRKNRLSRSQSKGLNSSHFKNDGTLLHSLARRVLLIAVVQIFLND